MDIPQTSFTGHTFYECHNVLPQNLIKETLAQIDTNKLEVAKALSTEEFDISDYRSSKIQWLHADSWVGGICHNLMMIANQRFFYYDINQWIDGIQITIYEEGDFYEWHTDGVLYPLNVPIDRKLSMSLLLNDDYEGGEIEFQLLPTKRTFKPKAGEGIIFPSWMPHRVLPITKGKRISLVAWLSGPAWR